MVTAHRQDEALHCWVLQPTRSLDWAQAKLLILGVSAVSLAIGGFFLHFGYPLILPFSGLEALAVAAAFYVVLRDGERCWFVALAEIQRIVVDGNYATVWFRGQKAMLPRSLAALEARLDPALFLRANRNTLVNLRAVRAIDPWVNDGYRLQLQDGERLA